MAPSGPVPPERLEQGLAVLRGWGLVVEVMPHVVGSRGEFPYLAASDADRAEDLRSAWCDPEVAAVICARGGYGAQRLTELLDFDALRAAGRKILVGFSDITALHEAFAGRLGLVTLHGPMAAGVDFLSSDRAREHLHSTLFHPERVRTLSGGRALVPGRAAGVTWGGCLSLLAAELGTPTGRKSGRGGLLVLEDTGEETYRLDRYLTQLLRAGALEGAAGVVLGSWQDCGPATELTALWRDRLGGLGIPVLEGLEFGHCPDALTVPLGATAELDADRGTLTFREPALS